MEHSQKRHRSVRDRAYNGIRERILNLTLPPGSLLSENELAAALDVSRTPVREAIVLLAREGLVQVYPKVGTFVSRVDPDQVKEAQFLREAVELASLASLTAPLDETTLASLRSNLELQDRVGDSVPSLFGLDEAFHRGLMDLAGHDASWQFVAPAKGHLDRARLLGLTTLPVSLGERVHEHHAIFDAVEDLRFDEATDLLRHHLRNIFADIQLVKAQTPELFTTDPDAQPTLRTVAVWQ